jgi:hypothetical protein
MSDPAQPQPQPTPTDGGAAPGPSSSSRLADIGDYIRRLAPNNLTVTAAPDALTEALVLANSTVQLAILVISAMPPADQAAAWDRHEQRMATMHANIAAIVANCRPWAEQQVQNILPPALIGKTSSL